MREIIVLQALINLASYARAVVAGPPQAGRSPRWPKVQREALLRDGFRCQYCKRPRSSVKLIGHHIQGYGPHPELELVLDNVITLCQPLGGGCHLKQGHRNKATGRCAWNAYNADIVADCRARQGEV